jgi:hypothetical protein
VPDLCREGKLVVMQQPFDGTTPLQLNSLPVGGPKSLRREGITDDLSQLSLCFRPVGVGHLPEAFCNPFPMEVYQRGSQAHCVEGGDTLIGGARKRKTLPEVMERDKEDRELTCPLDRLSQQAERHDIPRYLHKTKIQNRVLAMA